MRFISPYANFHLSVIDYVDEYGKPPGTLRTRGFVAQFKPAIWFDYERDLAYELWGERIKKGSRMLDSALTQPAPTSWRIGVFDSDQEIDDPELRKLVEERMLSSRKYGRDYAHAPEPPVAKPWPRYDDLKAGGRGRTAEMVAEEIVARVKDLGLDPADVIAYEKRNANRAEVLAALEVREPADEKIEVQV